MKQPMNSTSPTGCLVSYMAPQVPGLGCVGFDLVVIPHAGGEPVQLRVIFFVVVDSDRYPSATRDVLERVYKVLIRESAV